MANTRIIDDGDRNAQEWPFEGYATLPTSALPELPPFHYETVVVDGRITQCTAWSELPEITKMLRADHWRIIDDYPQIGSFLRLNGKGKFKASVLHSLMLRICLRLDKQKSKYEYWFLIKGKPVKFGVEEFSMVSGLRFGRLSDADSQTIDEGGNLKNRYFSQWGEMNVPVDAVITKISSTVSGNANPVSVCKLVFAWVISALLLPFRPIKEVPNSILDVCDDLAICERYPWGEKLWSVTIDALMEHMCSDRRMTSGDRIRRWNVGGFPHILLYWMLEAIEGMAVAANCYPRHDPALPRYPRMLRWDMGGGNWPNCDDMDSFFGNVPAVIPRLLSDNTESEMEYYMLAKELSDSVSPNNRSPSYRLLTEYFGELYVVVRDDEGAPEFLNRPPSSPAPDHAHAPAPAPARQQRKRVRRNQDGASTSQAQPQPSSSEPRYEEVPAWARDMEQKLWDHQNEIEQRQIARENEIVGQLNSMQETQTQMQVTLHRLHRMMLRDRGDNNVGEDDDDEDQGNNAEDNSDHGDLGVDNDDTSERSEPRQKRREDRIRWPSRHVRSPHDTNVRKK